MINDSTTHFWMMHVHNAPCLLDGSPGLDPALVRMEMTMKGSLPKGLLEGSLFVWGKDCKMRGPNKP